MIANQQIWFIKNLSANGEDPQKKINEFEKEFESILQAQVEEVKGHLNGHLMETFKGSANRNKINRVDDSDISRLNPSHTLDYSDFKTYSKAARDQDEKSMDA